MVIKLETDSLPLAKLQLHPKNVRAKSPETYGADQIAPLAASIAAVGLLNPLTVQKTEVCVTVQRCGPDGLRTLRDALISSLQIRYLAEGIEACENLIGA